MNSVCFRNCSVIITWHDGDGLEGPKYTKCSKTGQIANLHANGGVAAGDDDEIEPIPWIAQVCVLVEDEAFCNTFDYHFRRVDR